MRKLLMVSNRLPLTFRSSEDQGLQVVMSAGGLATALRAIAGQRSVRWIGWAGLDCDPDGVRDVPVSGVGADCELVPVFLSETDRRDFYCGFCNEIVWPLFHCLQPTTTFEPAYWKRYLDVNSRYAETIRQNATPDDQVWVHDYHLMLQGKLLSCLVSRDQLSYFHHIPFPPANVYANFPWRLEVLDSLLSFGTIGFQTDEDCRNFLASVAIYFPQAQVTTSASETIIMRGNGKTVLRHCPIGIDFDDFADLARLGFQQRRMKVLSGGEVGGGRIPCRQWRNADLTPINGEPKTHKAAKARMNKVLSFALRDSRAVTGQCMAE